MTEIYRDSKESSHLYKNVNLERVLKGLPLSWSIFLLNAFLFIVFLPVSKVDNDFSLGLVTLESFRSALNLFTLPVNEGVSFDEATLRLVLLAITILELAFLYLLGLIKKESLIVYLIWPYSAWLAVRLKFEFLVYPLCAVREDLGKKANLLLSFMLVVLAITLSERNFIVVALFRFILMFTQESKRPIFLMVIGGLFCVVMDHLYIYISDYVPFIRSFVYTRDVVNPEYSVIESFAVFIASFHLSVNPTKGWPFHILFGLLVFAVVLIYRNKINYRVLAAFVLTYLATTSITHAFQKASYYYFFLTSVLTPIVIRNYYFFIVFGILHVVLACGFYLFQLSKIGGFL